MRAEVCVGVCGVRPVHPCYDGRHLVTWSHGECGVTRDSVSHWPPLTQTNMIAP